MINPKIKRSLTKSQAELISQSMPWGVFDSMYILGATSKDKEWYYKVLRNLRVNGMIRNIVVPKGSKVSKKECLTQSGIQAFCESLDPICPLRKLLAIDDLSIRSGKNGAELLRRANIADAQTFLFSAGVDNIFSVFYRGVNPFVFGCVHPFSVDPPTLADCSINLMMEYIDAQTKNGTPIPQCQDGAIFLPNRCNPYVRSTDENGDIISTPNNTLGVLIDYKNRNVYAIIKSNDRRTIEWRTNVYRDMGNALRTDLNDWMINKDKYGSRGIYSAIILCETDGELIEKIKLCHKYDGPYSHIYLLKMKRDGLAQIREMIDVGEDEYLMSRYREIVSKLSGATLFRSVAGWGLKYQGETLIAGTIIDVAKCHDLWDRRAKRLSPYYVACYERQLHIYRDIVQVSTENILIVPED